jgi:outer membrane protein OmpA-like peptidoglycan-associated protein
MRTLLFSLCFAFSLTLYSQADSLVIVQGKIFNAETKEPVVARITYQSLPYGNRLGVLNNSSFSFPLFDNDRYSIEVEAVGYASVKYMLDPAEANEQKQIIRDIELRHTTGDPSKKHEIGKVLRLDNLIFEVAKSKIDPDSYAELDLVVGMMDENKSMVIQLEGHTDYLGDASKNMKLSEQRVESVKNYLVSKGIHKKRIKIKAFGGTMPLSHDNTPEGHRLNRRVELRILQN